MPPRVLWQRRPTKRSPAQKKTGPTPSCVAPIALRPCRSRLVWWRPCRLDPRRPARGARRAKAQRANANAGRSWLPLLWSSPSWPAQASGWPRNPQNPLPRRRTTRAEPAPGKPRRNRARLRCQRMYGGHCRVGQYLDHGDRHGDLRAKQPARRSE
jgi:hypothetical protein